MDKIDKIIKLAAKAGLEANVVLPDEVYSSRGRIIEESAGRTTKDKVRQMAINCTAKVKLLEIKRKKVRVKITESYSAFSPGPGEECSIPMNCIREICLP
ncbi:hypothetical protein KJ841_00490 [Patescibacteria group bacterium]|nr:hypothetical protein [Patescibacteria group bacterium]